MEEPGRWVQGPKDDSECDLDVTYCAQHTTAADLLFDSQHLYFAPTRNEIGTGLAQSVGLRLVSERNLSEALERGQLGPWLGRDGEGIKAGRAARLGRAKKR